MGFSESTSAALNPVGQIHYIDHLAVISIIMGIPLIFYDEQDYELGIRYYPRLKAIKEEYDDINPESLMADYDVIFTSDLWAKEAFEKHFNILEKKYNKQLRRVFCPHGFSDKGFYFKGCAFEDICLIYGQNMKDLLNRYHALEQLSSYVITGNYRYAFYLQHQDFYSKVVEEEILSKFSEKRRPLIIYAPTWQDYEDSTTFFDSSAYIMGQLPSDYNMIVKLHPMLEQNDPGAYYRIMGKFEQKPNIHFIREFPPVYPLLATADIYLGDMSSVGYDFLAFNRPMFFLNKLRKDSKIDPSLFLYRCGVEILPENFPKLYQIIDQHLAENQETLTSIRSEIYDYTFGKEKSFASLKKEIAKACESQRK